VIRALDAPESALERDAIRLAETREATGLKSQLRAHGVVHTPLPLVRYALSRVHDMLVSQLALPNGLASPEVSLLDPAAGTGVWLASALAQTRGAATAPSLLGFDTDLHALDATRALLASEVAARGLSLTLRHENTLGLRCPWPDAQHVRVVVGNPPWGARSLSKGLALSDAWLREFHHDGDGIPLNERRSGVLSDDYVRFFRWALQQAREAANGALVCFVTNASYLEGPVHRGMRGALLAAFDEIEIVDLGGNALLSRADATHDQSLFPVRVGVALTICVRRAGPHPRHAAVSYARLRGSRNGKLAALTEPLASTYFAPTEPAFRFCPQARVAAPATGFSLAEAFPFHAEGVQTNRDALATAATREVLIERLKAAASGALPLAASRHFDPGQARRRCGELLEQPDRHLARLAYRPFEQRVYVTASPPCHRPRPLLRRAVQHSTLSLLSVRKEPGAAAWNMFAVCRDMADSSFLSTRSSCRTRLFPSHGPDGAANLSEAVAQRVGERIGRLASSEELIAYALGTLGAPLYRSEHAAEFKHDYPRLPWPDDTAAFERSVAAGRQFVWLLCDASASHPDVWLKTQRAEHEPVRRKTLRWLAPHHLELAHGAEIGVGSQHAFSAQVGHHAIVESAFRGGREATIRTVLQACQRAVMWGEAEKAADSAYRPATSVRPNAIAVAVID